jgi:hypothetical protein
MLVKQELKRFDAFRLSLFTSLRFLLSSASFISASPCLSFSLFYIFRSLLYINRYHTIFHLSSFLLSSLSLFSPSFCTYVYIILTYCLFIFFTFCLFISFCSSAHLSLFLHIYLSFLFLTFLSVFVPSSFLPTLLS